MRKKADINDRGRFGGTLRYAFAQHFLFEGGYFLLIWYDWSGKVWGQSPPGGVSPGSVHYRLRRRYLATVTQYSG